MSEHEITVVPVAKMDTPTGLFTWRCTCERTTDMIGSENGARRAGQQHADARNATATRQVALLGKKASESKLPVGQATRFTGTTSVRATSSATETNRRRH